MTYVDRMQCKQLLAQPFCLHGDNYYHMQTGGKVSKPCRKKRGNVEVSEKVKAKTSDFSKMTEQNIYASFFSGISGVVLPIPKYKFPEDFQKSSRLTYYSSLFNSVEINRSFYVLPNGKTLAKWSNEVPENFKFTFKLWKQITHAKGLEFHESDVKNFMDAIENVGDKKGCLLIQFPASIKKHNIDQLQHLLHVVQINNSSKLWKVAIEFRDNSWYTEDTYNLVDAYGATVVIHDKSRVASPHMPH